MLAPHHSVFTGRMPFLPPNQQRQSTEGNERGFMILILQSVDNALKSGETVNPFHPVV